LVASIVIEPILIAQDREAWDAWQRTALVHAKSVRFARRLAQAIAAVDAALATSERPCVMWSGGKDSTVLAHLVCVEMGWSVAVASEKDDLDYPGEREYVEKLARDWDVDLTILTPMVSPGQWIADHAAELSADDDMHSRAAGLSKACFYEVVERWAVDRDLVFLGLRKDESRGRMLNRVTHGLTYRKRDGQTICQPLGDWSGLDVMAYLASRGIDQLPVYRCIGLMHRDEPWRLRKSWWIPGAATRWGGVVWLRRYYPSLFRQLCQWLPDTSRVG
jgi:3'-phosphoadenosine 5'-phosphosulfate sulfotransferase (PAPS reductase)/FAD synthetase